MLIANDVIDVFYAMDTKGQIERLKLFVDTINNQQNTINRLREIVEMKNDSMNIQRDTITYFKKRSDELIEKREFLLDRVKELEAQGGRHSIIKKFVQQPNKRAKAKIYAMPVLKQKSAVVK